MLDEFISKLPDDKYRLCKVTDDSVILPIEINKDELIPFISNSITDIDLTSEKALYTVIICKTNAPVFPVYKLSKLYNIKRLRR